jgi:hypothetical protein
MLRPPICEEEMFVPRSAFGDPLYEVHPNAFQHGVVYQHDYIPANLTSNWDDAYDELGFTMFPNY